MERIAEQNNVDIEIELAQEQVAPDPSFNFALPASNATYGNNSISAEPSPSLYN